MNTILLKLLQFGLFILTMALLIGSVRGTARTTAAGRIVEYGRPVKILFSAFVPLLAVMIAQVLSGNPKASVTDWRVPALFGLLLIPMLWEFSLRRVILSENSFTVFSPWWRRKEIEWSQITKIEYSKGLNWHVIRTSKSGSVYLSDLLSGKAELLTLAQAALCCSELESGKTKFLPTGETTHTVQPAAAPNGGPAPPLGTSGVGEGPPSVS